VKFASWNVNGVRACCQKTFFDWLAVEKPDVVCLQETKAHPDQLSDDLLAPEGYVSHWHAAEKRGYSGVSVLVKKGFEPLSVTQDIGVPEFDREGRTLVVEYPDFTLVNAYFPNGQRDHARVPFKLRFCRAMEGLTVDLLKSGKEIIICGDFNTAHREIDLRNPKQNVNTTGFLPEERAWLDAFLQGGFADVFREKNPDPGHYTWWSYRPGVRERNIGWRIDYFFVSPGIKDRVKTVYHQPEVLGSDHCPIALELAR
jgi:exodeoxyribonuclease-3